jgi:hypothetical protein
MRNEEKFLKNFARRPHATGKHFSLRPYFSRRNFFHVLGAGVSGMSLAGKPVFADDIVKRGGAPTIDQAKNVIFILLAGAASHTDTFDFKQSPDTPMNLMKPDTINGITWPVGLMPKLGAQLGDIAIVRSVTPWNLQHQLAQTWAQIGRSPAGVLGDVAPNFGSIVAVEKESERKPGQVFPTFLALSSGAAIGAGFLSADYAPFKIDPGAGGLPDTVNPDGQTRFESKYGLMKRLDARLRNVTANPYAKEMADYDNFDENGKAMMFNNTVNAAFRFTADEQARYGNSGVGNSFLTAAKVMAANGGTRYIMITVGGWDNHQNIYNANVLPANTRNLDNGLATMMDDLRKSGNFNDTLIVMMGEFGRTTGKLNNTQGRDHYSQQFVMFAGAGVHGGRTIGATNNDGSRTTETGWSRDRNIRPEDVECTIYSALGIDYASVRYDDPFRRGFYYVPDSQNDTYGPIEELWG